MQDRQGSSMKRFVKLGIILVGLAWVLVARRSALFAGGSPPTDFGPLRASHSAWEGLAFSSAAGQGPTFVAEDMPVSPSASEKWQIYPVYGGEMTSIAMGAAITEGTTHLETVYVGTRDAGVFKTTDGGQSWQPARTGLTFYPIRSLQVDLASPDTLYAGTDYDGIWKSTDGADSWFRSGQGIDRELIVFSIAIDPHDPDTLYAGLGGGMALVVGNIYKSEDGGAHWEIADAGLPRYSETSTHTNAVFSLVVDPLDPARLYAGTHFDGAFASTDGGQTWSAINDGLPFMPNSDEYREPVNALALDPHHANRLSALIGGEYYVFEDGHWQKINQGLYDANTGIGRAHIYFHPTHASVIYSAGDRFSKSTDAGVTWTRHLGWPESGHVSEIAFHPSFPDTIYAATDILMTHWGGVYKSSDQGETWAEASLGITAVPVQSVAIDPQDRHRIYAGTGGGHFYRTEDGGATWSKGYRYIGSTQIEYSLTTISDIAVDPLHSEKVYVAATSFYTSTNYGRVFEEIEQVEYPVCIAIAPHASGPIYVGTRFGNGVYKSSDGGASWSQITETLPSFGSSVCPILSIAVDPNDPETVWAGTQYGGGIVKSTDGGETWQVKGLTETNFVEAIAVNPENSDQILVGAGFWEGGIFKSTDGGNTWRETISGIALVQDLVFDPRNSRWVYAATEGQGVLRSFDGGETWQDYSAGIFYPLIYSLAVAEGDPPLLVAGSYSSGLYWTEPSAPTLVYLPLVIR